MSENNQIPRLDIESITQNDKEGGQGSSGRLNGQRPVKQAITTVLRIDPQDWNNVPKIIYEGIAKIVAAIDDAEAKKKQKYDAINKEFRDVRQVVTMIEQTMKQTTDKLTDQITDNQKLCQKQFINADQKLRDTEDSLNWKIGQVAEAMDQNSNKDDQLRMEVENMIKSGQMQQDAVTSTMTQTMDEIKNLQDSLNALKKQCETNFNPKPISESYPKFTRQSEDSQDEGDGGPNFEDFQQLMKFMMAKPFEKIEEGEKNNKNSLQEVKKAMQDQMKEQHDALQELLNQFKEEQNQRRLNLEENLLKMDERYKDKIRDLEETLINEELIPPPENDSFYNEPSPFENSGVDEMDYFNEPSRQSGSQEEDQADDENQEANVTDQEDPPEEEGMDNYEDEIEVEV